MSISASEVSDHEFVNMASLAFVSVSNDNDFSKSLLEKVVKRIEENYQVEILEENMQDYYKLTWVIIKKIES